MTIVANGSKYFGQKPDTIDVLFKMLIEHPLDAVFEDFGNFITKTPNKDEYRIFGNFRNISHVFYIVGTAKETKEIRQLIRNNQKRSDYEKRNCS